MVNELLLKHYQAGKFGIPIALPNHTFKYKSAPVWAEWKLFPTNAYKGNFRDTEQAGLLQINLFVPVGTKTDAIERKAQEIVDWFGTEVQHHIDGKNIMIMSSIAKDAMPDGEGYYMQPVVIAYRVI